MPDRTQPLYLTEREWVVLVVAMATLRSNLDAVKESLAPENEVYDKDGPTQIVLVDTEMPTLTEAEVEKLEDAIRNSPIFRKIKVASGTYEPDHLLGLLNSFRRHREEDGGDPIPGRYIKAYAVEDARLVYAARAGVPGFVEPVTDVLLVSTDHDIRIVKLGDDPDPEVNVHPARLTEPDLLEDG